MSTNRFFVSSSEAVREMFRTVMENARSQGKLKSAVQAAEWIFEELARTPMEFGESRDEYPSLDLHVRLAIIGPLAVQFAVNVEQKMVFLLWFRLRAN